MKLFFDTEFTGLHKNTTLISIGIVSEGGKSFYAECNDFDISQCDDWIMKNVVSNLYNYYVTKRKSSDWESGVADTQIFGAKKEVTFALKDWLQQFDSVQFVSDVCHYDFVLLIDLFGGAFDLPENVNPACHDINQDIAKYYGISEKEAFDMSREAILAEKETWVNTECKHNALYDAIVICAIYEAISKKGH
jgi:uncharacterized protein YlaN (UPF0358 family)